MRHKQRFNAARLSGSVNLPWVADHITVYNPSQNLVYVRTTGNDIPPTVASADIYLLPYSAKTYPVQSAQFGIGIASLALPAPVFNALFPQDVEVFFTAGEEPPRIESIALSDFSSAAQLLAIQAPRPIGGYTDNVALLPGIRTIEIVPDIGVGNVSVFGVQSQRYYLSVGNVNQYNVVNGFSGPGPQPKFICPVSPEDDSTLQVITTTTQPTFSGYRLFGYQERRDFGAYYADNRQPVDVFPVGAVALPVSLWPALPTPTVRAFANVVAPGAGVAICTTGALAVGEYRVEAEMSSTDTPGAAGKYMTLLHNAGVKSVTSLPCPGSREVIWSRVVVATGDIITIASQTAAPVAGSVYTGEIRAYKIA